MKVAILIYQFFSSFVTKTPSMRGKHGHLSRQWSVTEVRGVELRTASYHTFIDTPQLEQVLTFHLPFLGTRWQLSLSAHVSPAIFSLTPLPQNLLGVFCVCDLCDLAVLITQKNGCLWGRWFTLWSSPDLVFFLPVCNIRNVQPDLTFLSLLNAVNLFTADWSN